MIGVIVAALISGVFLLLAHGSGNGKQSAPTSNSKVNINIPPTPALRPSATPSTKAFSARTANLQTGQCAYVFAEPRLLGDAKLGCVNAGTTVEIYCTVESQPVGTSQDTVWDVIYYRTDWGTIGYIPDYYVNTGTNNAVRPSCVS
jgi:hypothetical protein